MSEICLKTEALSIGYARNGKTARVLAEDLCLSVQKKEFVCLVGPNGAGKSTLLRSLAGLQTVLNGQVMLKDAENGIDAWVNVHSMDATQRAKRMSVVLTERVDPGNLTAYDLAALGRFPYTDWTGRLSPADKEIVRWAMESVGAEMLAERNIHELSDGERQRVMIARALAQEPDIIILDEPTAFLDFPHRVEIMSVLKQLARTTGQAILLSTHDLDLALRSADTLWLLSLSGSLQCGAPEDLVLSGAFEETFAFEDTPHASTEFNRHTGTFVIQKSHGAKIDLIGHGLYTSWTARALEREGFRVQRRGRNAVDLARQKQSLTTAFQIEVMNGNQKARWLVADAQGEQQEYQSIQEVMASLKQTGKI